MIGLINEVLGLYKKNNEMTKPASMMNILTLCHMAYRKANCKLNYKISYKLTIFQQQNIHLQLIRLRQIHNHLNNKIKIIKIVIIGKKKGKTRMR